MRILYKAGINIAVVDTKKKTIRTENIYYLARIRNTTNNEEYSKLAIDIDRTEEISIKRIKRIHKLKKYQNYNMVNW